jgi:hypothetical protein
VRILCQLEAVEFLVRQEHQQPIVPLATVTTVTTIAFISRLSPVIRPKMLTSRFVVATKSFSRRYSSLACSILRRGVDAGSADDALIHRSSLTGRRGFASGGTDDTAHHISTRLIHAGQEPDPQTGAVVSERASGSGRPLFHPFHISPSAFASATRPSAKGSYLNMNPCPQPPAHRTFLPSHPLSHALTLSLTL